MSIASRLMSRWARDVDVRARPGSRWLPSCAVPARRGGGLFQAKLRPRRMHRLDRPGEIASGVGDDIGEERLVEMGMGLDRAAQQQALGWLAGAAIATAAVNGGDR